MRLVPRMLVQDTGIGYGDIDIRMDKIAVGNDSIDVGDDNIDVGNGQIAIDMYW